AAAPDVRMRVVEHPVTTEPALRIRLDRGDARSKVRRLKALIRERFATDDQSYGLRLDEGWDARPADLPLVLLVQGYGDSPESLGGLHGELVEHGFPCATFAYPNDGPLTEAAELLAAELHDFQEEHPDRNIAAVTHSMGGLVVRAVIEDSDLDPGNVSRLIMVCPPNHGSPWAELPGGLECWEYLQEEERDSLGNAFNASVSDGLNEARTDLKPGSRFLHELNARERNPNVHYSLLLGTGSPFTEKAVCGLHERVARSLADDRTGRFFMPRVDGFFAGLEELASGRGDGVVSITSGQLEGVRDVVLLPIHHGDATGELSSPVQQLLLGEIVDRLERTAP
ncbi:MAG: esterase/lipase family protein, partial [Planctomycetaceae bacterium]